MLTNDEIRAGWDRLGAAVIEVFDDMTPELRAFFAEHARYERFMTEIAAVVAAHKCGPLCPTHGDARDTSIR